MTNSAYPVGQCWQFHVGPMTIEHEIRSMTSIHSRHVDGPLAGKQELLSVTIVSVRDALFVVSWQEADSSTGSTSRLSRAAASPSALPPLMRNSCSFTEP